MSTQLAKKRGPADADGANKRNRSAEVECMIRHVRAISHWFTNLHMGMQDVLKKVKALAQQLKQTTEIEK